MPSNGVRPVVAGCVEDGVAVWLVVPLESCDNVLDVFPLSVIGVKATVRSTTMKMILMGNTFTKFCHLKSGNSVILPKAFTIKTIAALFKILYLEIPCGI